MSIDYSGKPREGNYTNSYTYSQLTSCLLGTVQNPSADRQVLKLHSCDCHSMKIIF